MGLIDSHSHLNDEKFDEDREKVIKDICESGVTSFITAGYSVESSKKALEIANLTTKDFAGLTIDDISNYTRETTEDNNGNVIDIDKSEINYLLDNKIDKQYSLRYEEFIAIAIDQIQKLKKRVDKLEKDNEELRHKLTDKQ